jgi:hypothetical protein
VPLIACHGTPKGLPEGPDPILRYPGRVPLLMLHANWCETVASVDVTVNNGDDSISVINHIYWTSGLLSPNLPFLASFLIILATGATTPPGKYYVPTRSQRARSVPTFFAQDTGNCDLVYANADLSKVA